MACPGIVEVFYEPFNSSPNLYVFGGGHVGSAVLKFSTGFGFNITVLDPRSEILDKIELPNIKKLHGEFTQLIDSLDFMENDFVVIVTHNHEFDELVLRKIIKKNISYLGMMGSKKKVRDIKEKFLSESFCTEKELDRVKMPIGLSLNTFTPDEIAIAILAEMIDIKNSGK